MKEGGRGGTGAGEEARRTGARSFSMLVRTWRAQWRSSFVCAPWSANDRNSLVSNSTTARSNPLKRSWRKALLADSTLLHSCCFRVCSSPYEISRSFSAISSSNRCFSLSAILNAVWTSSKILFTCMTSSFRVGVTVCVVGGACNTRCCWACFDIWVRGGTTVCGCC